MGGHKKKLDGNPVHVKLRKIEQTGNEYDEILSDLRDEIEQDQNLNDEEKDILKTYTYTGDVLEKLYVVAGIDKTKLSGLSKKNKHFKAIFDKIRGIHASYVSSLLWDAVKAREPWAIKVYLATHTEEFSKTKDKSASGFDDYVEQKERDKQVRDQKKSEREKD